MNLVPEIKKDIANKVEEPIIAERFFVGSPIMAFRENPRAQIEIFEEIKNFFNVPYSSIYVAGSARIGYSAHKKRNFTPGVSDLDIAIVSHSVYTRLLSEAARVTKGFRDSTKFDMNNDISALSVFKDYLAKGMIMTKFLPSCMKRSEIDRFFGSLQRKHPGLFREISAAIYLDEVFYIQKQRSFIKNLEADGL